MMCYEHNDRELIVTWDQSPWIGRALIVFGAVFDVVGMICWLPENGEQLGF